MPEWSSDQQSPYATFVLRPVLMYTSRYRPPGTANNSETFKAWHRLRCLVAYLPT